MSETPEEDTSGSTVRGKPNRFWAEHKDDATTTYGGAFRGTPSVRRGGSQRVDPEETLGDMEHCWCGQLTGHDWPGKSGGARHPRKEQHVSAMTNEEAPHLDPRQVKGLSSDMMEIAVQAVNTYGLQYKVNSNGIRLYPKDGGRPYMLGHRDAGPALKRARMWFAKNVVGISEEGVKANPLIKDPEIVVEDFERRAKKTTEEFVEEALLQALAEKMNNPAEHPDPPKPKAPMPTKVVGTPTPAWVPHIFSNGEVSERFETDGTRWRCKECPEFLSDSINSLGGHVRMHHRPVEDLHGPEARLKAVDTRKYETLRSKVTEAIDLIADLVDYETSNARVGELEDQLTESEGYVKKLIAENEKLQEWVEAHKKRADEAEARLALMREALGA